MDDDKDEVMEEILKARQLLVDAINKSSCGYCKMIMADVVDIIDKYNEIVDKAKYISDIATEQKEFLTEANRKADEMLPKPIEHTEGGSGLIGRGIIGNGPLRRRINSWKQGMDRFFDLNIE
ncbi:MAG: hypothetical protein ACP5G1_03400 [Nanopusillaceae archaeon]|jgi:hypothetical protein